MSAKGVAVRREKARAHAELVEPFIRDAQRAGATSLRQLAAALTARGVRTPSGRAVWHAAQVRNALFAIGEMSGGKHKRDKKSNIGN